MWNLLHYLEILPVTSKFIAQLTEVGMDENCKK